MALRFVATAIFPKASPGFEMYALSAGEAHGTESGGRRGVIVRRPAVPQQRLTVRLPVEPEEQIVYLDELEGSPTRDDGQLSLF